MKGAFHIISNAQKQFVSAAVGDRLVVGQQTLDLPAEVRPLLPQPTINIERDQACCLSSLLQLPDAASFNHREAFCFLLRM